MSTLDATKSNMSGMLERFIKNLSTIKVGNVRADFLDSVIVSAYDQELPIRQVASINVFDNNTLHVNVFDKAVVKNTLSGIQEANLGVSVIKDGDMIKVMMPKITEEIRKKLCKVAKEYAEDAKVTIRNVRRDSINDVKKAEKNGLSKNDSERQEKEIQKLTDSFILQIDTTLKNKEQEIMKI